MISFNIYWHVKRFFKVFTISGHGCHLGHVTWTKYINFLSLLLDGCWTDARRPIPRLWIRSAEVRGGGGGGGTSLGEWEHNNNSLKAAYEINGNWPRSFRGEAM